MVRQTLLRLLEELTDEELRTFVFLAQGLPHQPCRIPRGKLENVSRVQLAELLLKYYPGVELNVAAQVLEGVPRRDLLKKYNLRGQEETPRAEAAPAAGTHLQEQQLHVSENSREATPSINSLAETAPVQGRISEKDLMKLAKNLGRNWRAIGIEYLEVPVSRLEQIEEENPGNAVMRNFYMLKVWKNCEGERATPDRLYHILSQEGVSLDPDAIKFLSS
ncbi:uncharacterized protein LOC132581485 [Heteronotia binoei]|uniref:uncharacterized protein LOC132581485 n=1 Tax=Heteronotia binoei TaxID=13085 RepID=UPI00292F6033|nr:uncharacterized protein LOC132581485 [Heteronotia binoei]